MSVRLFVTSQSYAKTAKHRTAKTTSHDITLWILGGRDLGEILTENYTIFLLNIPAGMSGIFSTRNIFIKLLHEFQ